MSPRFNNCILSRFTPEDLALLADLRPVELRKSSRLELANRPIERVFFPESGLASVIARGSPGKEVEVGMVGTDGMTGLAVALGLDRTATQTVVQIAGQGYAASSAVVAAAMDKSPALRHVILAYCHDFMLQAAYTALSNGKNKIDERLARWLLMTDDRVDHRDLALTHEFLAIMLGVRRAGVSLAVESLSERGIIAATRGSIRILHRDALISMCGGTYLRPGERRPQTERSALRSFEPTAS
jgi:CRP-like cAMP-binding protein